MVKWKEATIKALIVLVPAYTAAYLTEKMVWVVPTLAASGFFAGTVSFSSRDATRRVEEDGETYDLKENQKETEEFEFDAGLDEDGADG